MLDFEKSVQATWDLFYQEGQIVEVRAMLPVATRWVDGNFSTILSGYFDNYPAFLDGVRHIEQLQRAQAIYVTLNPVQKDLLGRAANRIVGMTKKASSTSDRDISWRRWVLLDYDPIRPSGISATEAELGAAIARRDESYHWLRDQGFPDMVQALSGNGAHLLIPIDLPNDDSPIVAQFLDIVGAQFGDARDARTGVAVDSTVGNAARITKLYGTKARKGDNIPDRPWRDSGIEYLPETLTPMDQATFTAFVHGHRPPEAPRTVTPVLVAPNWATTVEGVEGYLADHGVVMQDREAHRDNGFDYKWIVDCVTSGGRHTDGAVVMWGANKGLAYKCHHDSCNGKGWSDVRALIDPKKPSTYDEGDDIYAGFSPVHTVYSRSQKQVLHVTAPYTIYQDRLTLLKRVKDGFDYAPIADFTAKISQTIVGEHGDQVFIITGSGVRGGAFTVEIPATDYGNATKLKQLLEGVNPLDGVAWKMGDHLGPAIKRLTTETTTSRRFARTGWANGRFLIHGREPAGVEIKVDDKATSYRVDDQARPDLALKVVEGLIDALGPNATVLISFVLGAPLAALMGLRTSRYALFMAGVTGSMKTTSARLAMSLWGARFATEEVYEKLGKFGATVPGLIGRAAEVADLPWMLDNYKPNTMPPQDMVSLIHALIEGQTKSGQKRDNTIRRTIPLWVWPLITGEDVPGNDVAALARMLVIELGDRHAILPPGIAQATDNAEHGNAVGREWLQLLEQDGDRVTRIAQDAFRHYRDVFREHIRVHAPKAGNALRSATNFAANMATFVALCELPLLRDLFTLLRDTHLEHLLSLAAGIGKHTEESSEGYRYLNILYELIDSGRVFIRPLGATANPTDQRNVIGWHSSKGICLYKELARAAVDNHNRDALNGITANALHKQLAEMGAIVVGRRKDRDGHYHPDNTPVEVDPTTGKGTRVLIITRTRPEATEAEEIEDLEKLSGL